MIDRYSSKQMSELWSPKKRFEAYLKVELAATEGFYELGVVPKADYELIKKNASFTLERIAELEAITHHDLVAFTRAVSESLGQEAKWIHYGLTSTDVVDTANGYMLAQANTFIKKAYVDLLKTLKQLALKYKNTPCIGRTHGVHADITSFGFKFAYFYEMLERTYQRFLAACQEVEVGKISGAVGNYANVDMRIEQAVCKKLNLTAAKISTQVLSRERYANYFAQMALTGSVLEAIATEIRSLARTEIAEVAEYFAPGQKGSSAMPHKKNPVSCENICGLARVLRGYQLTAFEDINLWHERDISHSSAERIIFVDATTLMEYILVRMNKILNGLQVYPDKMLANIALTNKNIYSQRVMTALIEKNMTREQAYDLVQPLTFSATPQEDFQALVQKNAAIKEKLTEEEINNCFTIEYYFKNIDSIFSKLGIL